MPHDIEWLKEFPAQVEKVGKIERNGGANGDIDNDIATDKRIEVNGKNVVKKKKFKNISKWYDKKENNIHDVQNDEKKGEGAKKKIDKIFKKKKKNIPEKKNDIILFECEKLQKINGKIELQSVLPQYRKQKKNFKKICKQKATDGNCNKHIQNRDWCCGY